MTVRNKPLRVNPWARDEDASQPAPPPPANEPPAPSYAELAASADGPVPEVTLLVPQYGSLTVKGASDRTEAMLRVLNYLTKRPSAFEDILATYGVLLAKIPKMPEGGFFIRKSDHWTLGVPEAMTREQALFQIHQALAALPQAPLKAEGIVVSRF